VSSGVFRNILSKLYGRCNGTKALSVFLKKHTYYCLVFAHLHLSPVPTIVFFVYAGA
jgi:hypothetical protein